MDSIEKINLSAPNFSLHDHKDEIHSLESYRGKIVIINFWSAECPWSKRVDEIIIQLAEDWSEDVVLLSIASNANESLDLIKEEANARALPILLLDKDQKVARLYNAITTPHIYVIDKTGKLRYQGAFDDVKFRQPVPTENYLIQAVESLLAGKNPEPTENPSYGCTVVYFSAELNTP